MKSLILLFAGCILICKSFSVATDDMSLMRDDDDEGNSRTFLVPGKNFNLIFFNVLIYHFFKEPDVSKLEHEPYEKFFEQRKLPPFPKDVSNDEEVQQDGAITRVERDNQEKNLLSMLTSNKKKTNKNKMDEKIKDAPHNSKFHGFQFQDA